MVLTQATRRRHSTGFTLLELSLSLGILVILLGAVTSMMSLAGRAIPKHTDSDMKVSTLRQKLGDMCDDLSLATSITFASATSITFVVPDRNNDGSPETLRYTWSATSGASLTRTDADSTDAPVISGVQSLVISLTTESKQRTVVSGTQDSAEQLLSSFTGTPSGHATSDSTTRFGLCIVPNLATDVTAWQLTRLRYQIKSLSGNSTAHTLSFCDSSILGWVDESAEIAKYDVAGSVAAVDEYLWLNVSTNTMPWMSASSSVWAVFGPPTLGSAKFEVPYATAGHMCYTDGRSRIVAVDVWGKLSRQYVSVFEAFGKVRTPASVTQSYDVATKVEVDVRLTTGETASLTARLWNQPEVP